MTNVLFVCVANSGRSVMAERLFGRIGGGRHQARSAGSDPGAAAHPQVVEALREVGIDASDHVPRQLDAEALRWADVAVSTCAEEVCPVTPGIRRIGSLKGQFESSIRIAVFSRGRNSTADLNRSAGYRASRTVHQ